MSTSTFICPFSFFPSVEVHSIYENACQLCDNLAWRDYIMLVGLAASITGLVLSILGGHALLTVALILTSITLSIGTYFVYEYGSLEGIRVERIRLASEVTRLSSEVTQLSETTTAQEALLEEGRVQQEELAKSVASLEKIRASLTDEFNRYREATPLLQQAFTQLSLLSSELNHLSSHKAELSRELSQTREELTEARLHYQALHQTSLQTQESLHQETTQLTHIRELLAIETAKLQVVSNRLLETS